MILVICSKKEIFILGVISQISQTKYPMLGKSVFFKTVPNLAVSFYSLVEYIVFSIATGM